MPTPGEDTTPPFPPLMLSGSCPLPRSVGGGGCRQPGTGFGTLSHTLVLQVVLVVGGVWFSGGRRLRFARARSRAGQSRWLPPQPDRLRGKTDPRRRRRTVRQVVLGILPQWEGLRPSLR